MRESDVQLHVCQYLRLQHPGTLFRSDYASGLRLSVPQAIRHAALQSNRGFPDLLLYEPRGSYVGMALEIKREGTRLYKRDGTPATPHIAEQAAVLEALAARGWFARFGVGFEDCQRLLCQYLGTRLP